MSYFAAALRDIGQLPTDESYRCGRLDSALRQQTAAAHIFQLLMAGQMRVIAWHAIRWFWRAPQTGLLVRGAQIAAALAAFAPVYLLGL